MDHHPSIDPLRAMNIEAYIALVAEILARPNPFQFEIPERFLTRLIEVGLAEDIKGIGENAGRVRLCGISVVRQHNARATLTNWTGVARCYLVHGVAGSLTKASA
ncbi:MAG: hypothetical protein AAFQ84_10275 [Pseudomonadota bacterium]